MKSSFHNIIIHKPFGNVFGFNWMLLLFAGSISIDLASTSHFLSRSGWYCKREGNPVAKAMFCFLDSQFGTPHGFYLSAVIILIGETLIAFFVLFPVIAWKIPSKYARVIQCTNMSCVLLFCVCSLLAAFFNWGIFNIYEFLEHTISLSILSYGQLFLLETLIAGSVILLTIISSLIISLRQRKKSLPLN